MLTVPEAARATGYSPETIRRWIRAGKLPATKVGTQHVIDERDLSATLGGATRTAEPQAHADGSPPDVVAALLRRIAIDPSILGGKPTIRGTRISVELVLDFLAGGWTADDILDSYPWLVADDVRACLAYASERVRAEEVYPLPRV